MILPLEIEEYIMKMYWQLRYREVIDEYNTIYKWKECADEYEFIFWPYYIQLYFDKHKLSRCCICFKKKSDIFRFKLCEQCAYNIPLWKKNRNEKNLRRLERYDKLIRKN